jgi:hypothetical protein
MIKPHKFFELQSNNDLNNLKKYLNVKYNEMKKINWTDKDRFYDPGNHWLNYNIFHFYNKEIYSLQSDIKKLVIDACNYYNIDFEKENYYIHGWFNYWPEQFNVGVDPDKLHYHDHGDISPNLFHGYYCVNAEPSITHYKIDDVRLDNINKNNKIIVSKNGCPHTPGAWSENSPRITIAYNISPLNFLNTNIEQGGQFIKL